jgi:dephospho-CoA kinase
VYIADLEAKKLMDSPKLKRYTSHFGNSFDSNHLVRAKLAEIVFSNPEKLEKLNAIVHPAVRKHFKDWVLRHKTIYFTSRLFYLKADTIKISILL